MPSACLLGGRFSIVAISQRIKAWYRETVQNYGLESRLASIRALDEPLPDIGNVQGNQGESLVALAQRCVAEDGADVIVLAGAPLAGLARIAGWPPAGSHGRWRVQRGATRRVDGAIDARVARGRAATAPHR